MTNFNDACRNRDSVIKVCNFPTVPDRFDFIFPPLCRVVNRAGFVGDLGNAPLHCRKGAAALGVAERTRCESKVVQWIIRAGEGRYCRRVWNIRISSH